MLGLGLSLIKGAGKNVGAFLSYIKDSLKLYYRFYDNSPELLLSGATSFDGDDYINTGTPFSNTNHTISAWVNASATGGVVFDNRDANDDGIRLIYDSSLIYQLNSSDVNLIQSLGRQVVRGIPLTDRQYDLAVVKCNDYYNILYEFGIDKTTFENLRMPLREIDRSKWVRKVEYKGDNCLAIRFTFNKKLIELLEKTRTKEKAYDRETKIHYFPYDEQTIFQVINFIFISI